MNKLTYILPLILIIQSGCTSTQRPTLTSISEYQAYYKNDSKEFIRQQKSKELQYTATYLPHEVLILKRNKSISEAQLQSELKKYNPLDWVFDYTIELNIDAPTDILKYNIDNLDDYRHRIQQLSAEGEKLFYLEIDGKEKLPCKQVVFDRTYGLSNKLSLRLFFRVNKKTASKQVRCIFNDEVFAGGIIKNDITEQITKSPILKLSDNVK